MDDEQPMAASVSRTYAIVDENQAGPVTFNVELSHPDTTASERNVAVAWQTTEGTATEGEDYLAAGGMLNFPVGSNAGILEVDLVDDLLFEQELETFTVELIDQGTRLATISPTENSFETSIRDNETLTASITADALNVVEGGIAGFTVRLTGGVSTEDVQVTFETGGDAEAGRDYDAPIGNLTLPAGNNTGSAGTLTIPARQKSGTITYPIKTDNIAEEDGETLEVQLFTVHDGLRSSGVSGSGNIASTTILDGDSLIVSIQGNPTVAEGGTATFSAHLSETEAEDVSVEWATTQPGNPLGAGETAEPDLDYTADSGTVVIPAGSTSATFTVTTNQDTLVEGAETFVVTLEQATKGTAQLPEMLTLGVTTVTGTITDDDTEPTGVTLSAVPDSVTEDAGATDISATVSLDGTTQFTHDTPVTIEFADRPGNPRNAILGVDYTAAPVNTAIPAGESGVTATITITPVDDNMEENNEIARLEAGSPDLSGTDALGVNITDNDTAVVEVELTATPGAVDETVSSTILTVTAALVGSSSRAFDTVIALSATGGTAESAEDYEFTDTTVTIPAGAMSANVSVSLTVLDDTLAEGDETFEIGGSITAASITVLPAEITIRDDDTEPTGIGLFYNAAPLDEGGSPASIDLEASLLGGGTRTTATQVSLRVVDLTTTRNDDYTASWYTLTLTIPAGEYSATAALTVTPVDDNLYEGTENLAVRATNSDPGLAVNGVRIPILDDDPQPTTITLSLRDPILSEQVKTWWVNVTATLEGASTLATDTVITTQLDPQGTARNTYGAILKSELRIEAGQSTATAEMLLTNIDDQVDDADETLVIGGTVSDPSLTVTPASLVITDDDTYGVSIWPTSLSIREGRRNNYNVKLDTEPTATVTVTIDLPADAGFTVSPGTLTFTPQSWGTKYVIVRGTQDEDAADEAAATITHSVITTDELYRNAATSDVSITVRDDETAGVTLSTTTLEVAEGEDATYTVVLDTAPVGDVTVTIGGVTGTDLSLDKTTLTFTTTDWDAAQTVTVTAGQDGDTTDDTATLTHTVASTADSAYDGETAGSIAVTVTDDDSAGVVVSESSLTIEEGNTATYTVVLNTEPTGDVTVTTGGITGTDSSLDKTSLTFTIQDWDTAQTVTVTAEQDDDAADEPAVTITHTVSSTDARYDGATTGSVTVTVTDDDRVGVTISQATLAMDEGDPATYTVVLTSEPAGDVTVTIEGFTDTDVSLDQTTLTFTTQNWDTAQTVTATAGQDEDAADEEVTLTHTVTSAADSEYDGLAADSVVVTVTDDDSVGVSISETALTIGEGDSATYTVALDSQPAGDVTVAIGGFTGTDLTLDKTTLTFTAQNWNLAQTVEVTAGQDGDTADDTATLTHTVTSAADSDYDGVSAGSIAVTITDDDVAQDGVTISPTSITVPEGHTAQYTAVLDSQPNGNVTITVNDPADNTDVTADPASLIFTTTNWDTPQSVTVTAAVDADPDDDSATVTHTVSGYGAVTTADDVAVTVEEEVVPLTVSFDESFDEVLEWTTLKISVTLSADPGDTVTIPLTKEERRGATSSDYSGVPGSLTFNSGKTKKTFTFFAHGDVDTDDGERVRIGFDTLPPGITAGENERIIVEINDLQGYEVNFDSDAYAVNEGETLTIGVTLTGSHNRTSNIGLKATDQAGASPADYSIPGTVIIGPGDTEGEFDFTASRDAESDDGEQVVIRLMNMPLGVVAGATNTATVTIREPPSQLTAAFEQDSYTAPEGGSVTIKVRLNADPERSVTIPLTQTGQGGATSSDYSGVPANVVFDPGDTEKTFIFSATADDQDDDGESVKLGFGTLPQGVSAGSTSETTVNITDDDGTPGLVVDPAELSISEAGTGTFSVKLGTLPSASVTVAVASGDTGVATALPASMTFTTGDWSTAQTVTVSGVNDTDADDETVEISLTATSTDPDYEGKDGLVNVDVADDDEPSIGTVSFEQQSYTVDEGSSAAVRVTLSQAPGQPLSIPITATVQGGASAADYSGVPGSLTFAAADTEQTINFAATDDTIDDDGESVLLGFGTMPAGVTAGTNAEATVSITDDDITEVTVSFEQASYTVAEGGTVSVKVKLDSDPLRTVTIPLIRTNQDGADAADYSGVPNEVTFQSGDTEKTITFAATQDPVDDDDESVKLSFGIMPNGVTTGTTTETVISIADDDVPEVTVNFERAGYVISEGSRLNIGFTVSPDPERNVSIPLQVSHVGGATDADHSRIPAAITFNAGQATAAFRFQATQDTLDDDDESVRISFGSNLPAGMSAGSTGETTVSIIDDDDPAVTVEFVQATYAVPEGSSVTVKVTLSADPERRVTIPLTTADQGGASSADYSGVPPNVTFEAGDTEQEFTFSAAQDAIDDDDESVKLTFSTMPDGVSAGSTSESVVSITDDDVPQLTANFVASTRSVGEGRIITITMNLSGNPEREVTIPLTTVLQGGASNSDYTMPGSVTLAADEDHQTFSFTAEQDQEDDDGESVQIRLGPPLPEGITAGTPDTVTVSINDDDHPQVDVNFEHAAYTVLEGGDVTVKVRLSADPERTVTIPVSRTEQGGASAADYSGVPASLEFASSETEKSFTFAAVTDDAVDDGESVKLGFGSLPAGMSAGTPGEAVVSIDDATRKTFIQRLNPNGTSNPSNTVAGEFKVRIHFNPSATGLAEEDLEITNGTVTDFLTNTHLGFDVWHVDILPTQGASTVTVRVPPDVVDGGNQPAEVIYDTSPPLTVEFTTTATEPVISDFQIRAIFSLDVIDGTLYFENANWYFVPTEDLDITHGTYVGHREVSPTVFTITVRPNSSLGTTVISLPQAVVATGLDTEVWNNAASIELQAGRRSVSLEQGSYTVGEGEDVIVKVVLDADPLNTVVIPLTAAGQGGAATPDDYSGIPASLTFTSGETEQSFTFSAADDSIDDDGEGVKIAIGTPLPNIIKRGSTDETTVSITDDDTAGVTVTPANLTVTEGRTATYTVVLDSQPTGDVTVTVKDPTDNTDVTTDPASLTFAAAAWDEAQEVTVSAAQDDDDQDESATVTHEAASTGDANYDGITTPDVGVTLEDDAPETVTVSFKESSYDAGEGSAALVTLTLDLDPERTVTVPLTQAGQNGAGANDYSGVPANVVFNSGDTEKSFTFSATDDAVDDDDESVLIGFGILPADVTAGNTHETTVSINDDDDPSVTVSFEQPTYTADEGSSVTVKVKLSADPERSVTIPLTHAGQGGAGNSDYSGVPANVAFNSRETEKTFSFSATADDVNDDDESVKLGFGNVLPAGVSTGTTNESIVSITDDDVPAVTVSFEHASYTVPEGSGVSIKVKLDTDPERSVTIPIANTNQSGASSADYSGVPGDVTIAPGDTEVMFTFAATQDTVDDDGESVMLGFGNLPAGVSAGSTDETVVSIADDDLPSVEVSFEQASYTVAEGSSINITVTLDQDPERTVTIPLTVTNQGGATSADHSLVPENITFNAGQTSRTFSFQADQDSDNDDGESVKLGFGNLPTGVSAGSIDETVVSITDDDHPEITVRFGSATYTANEGTGINISLHLNAQPERTVTVSLTKANQDGASNADYSGVPPSITFLSLETEKSFTFNATADSVDDDGESVSLGLSNLPDRVTAGTPDSATVSITDDDDPTVTVNFEHSTYTAPEGGTASVKVTLSAEPERSVAIPLTKTNQGGASSADYSGVPASLAFAPGETSNTFTVNAADDSVDDDGESVKLAFGNLPAGVNAGTTNEATLSITDNDHPADVTVSFEQSTYTVDEGESVTVTMTLSEAPQRNFQVPITKTNQGGATGADYTVSVTNVNFNAADTSSTFTVSATDDAEDDDGESVKIALGTLPTGFSAGSTSETVVSINDDDVPTVTVSFEHASYTAAEGSSVTVKVKLSANPERSVTVPLAHAGQGGATNADYSVVPANIAFQPGETEATFTFSATQDSVDDDGESVQLTFDTLPSGVSAGSTGETTVSIADDDDPNVAVSFGQSSYTAAEGGDVTITVTLSDDPERAVTVLLETTNQGGANPADYSGVPGSLTFDPGDTEKEFTFTAAADSTDDDGESVKITFGNFPTGVSAGSTAETTVNINDGDVPTVSVNFEQAAYTVPEGGTVTVKVTLSADPERMVEIPLETTGQGGADTTDYSGVPDSLTFDPGDTEKSFTITAVQDTVDDDDESVLLDFGNGLPDGVNPGGTDQATISITDDDVPQVTVSFEQSSYTVAEGSSVTVNVKLSADPERTLTILLSKLNQGGAANSDYSGVPSTITFGLNDTEKSFAFSAVMDSDNDDGESVKITFGAMPDRVSPGTTDETTVNITDDDVPQVTVSFEHAAYTVQEGNSINITMTLSADPERTMTVPLDITNQGGATDDDHSLVPDGVTFNPGQTSRTFSFQADQDTQDDDGESVRLGFGSTLPTGVSAGSTAETTVSITDDDGPSVTVSFEQASYTVAEGSSVTVTVALSTEPERSVTIPLTTDEQGGANGSDYSGVPASLTFDGGDTERTFAFSAATDSENDDGESVRLGFGSTLPAGVTAGSPSESTVSITDDDVPSVEVSFEQRNHTVAEGSSVTVKVKLDQAPERSITIPLSKTNQDGATSADYSGVPSTLTFGATDTQEEFTFAAATDSDNDDGESVKLGFGNLPTGVTAGSANETTISITDEDVPSVRVSFGQANYTVAEGSSINITVTLDTDPERTLEIPLTVTNLGGATNDDHSLVPERITFPPGTTSRTFSIQADEDTADDDGEKVRIGFGPMPDGASADTPATATVSITDDDDPQVSVRFGATTYAAPEGGSATVAVELSADPERMVTVSIAAMTQGGASAADYALSATTLTFDPGDTEKTLTLTATDDETDDDGESVKLSFTNLPTGVNAGTPSDTTVSITDNDGADVTVSPTTLTVQEGDDATYTVVLGSEPTGTVTITVGGLSGTGLSVDKSTLTFTTTTWDEEQTVTVSAAQDSDPADETATITHTVTSTDGVYDGITADSVSVTVQDDETPTHALTLTMAEPVHTDSDSSGDVNLGDVLIYTATATNSGNVPLANVKVKDLLVNTSGTDCASLAVGDTCVLTGGHTVAQRDVDAGNVSNTATATADDAPEQTVSRSVNVAQESAVSLEKTSAATGFDEAGDEVAYAYAVTNSGTVTLSGTLTIADDKIPAGITCEAVPQAGVAPGGVLTCTGTYTTTQADVNGSGVTNRATATLDGVSSAEVSLSVPWRAPQGDQPQVSVSNVGVGEGGGTAALSIALNKSSLQTITLDYETEDDTAESGKDYAQASGTVTFAPSETTKSVSIAITDDDIDEDNETFHLALSNPENATIAAGSDSAVIAIHDDDTAGVTVAPTTLTIKEGDEGEYTVVLDSEPTDTVTVAVGSFSGTGLSVDRTSLTFTTSNWDTAQTVTVSAGEDVDSDDESGTITHTVSSTGDTKYDAITADGVSVSIEDDDDTQVSVSFEQGTYTVAEGSSVSVKVKLSQAPGRTVTIPLTKTNQDGASDSDYSGVPASVTFNSDDTEKTFALSATDDSLNDDGESVKLTFGTLPAGVSEGATDETVVSITDNDGGLPDGNREILADGQSSIAVSFEQATYAAQEGGTATVKVTLSAAAQSDFSLPLTATAGSGLTTSDYSGVPASLDFPAGDTEISFVITAEQDAEDESSENLTLGFGTLLIGLIEGTNAQAEVTIIDSVHVSFGASSYEAHEGGAGALVTVELDSAAATQTVIPITAAGMNGATQDDWTGVPPMLSFSNGQLSKTFTLMAYDDSIEDDGEAVELGFGPLPDGVASTSPSIATVHLMNTESPGTEEPEPAQCDNQANKIILLDAVGEITTSGANDFWEVDLDPFKSYLFEAIGADDGRDLAKEDTYDGDLTLEDPEIIAVWKWHEGRMDWFQVSVASWIPDDLGYGRNSILGTKANSPATYRLEVAAGGDGTGTGTYQVKVRVNNFCIMVNGEPLYQYFGGPEGYSPSDIPADTSTRWRVNPGNPASSSGNFLGDNWDPEPDEDWIGAELTLGYEYTVELWTRPDVAEEHQAKKLKILGIYKSDGTEIAGTASSKAGKKVSVVFQPESTGLHYIAVGSNGIETTGLYKISAIEREIPGRAGRGETVPEDQRGKNGGNNGGQNNPTADDEPERKEEKAEEADEPNSPASGQPVITGTAQAGLLLTADTSGISDDDGLSNAQFSYQWIVNDGQTDTDIGGETGSTYTPTEADAEKTIRVRVSFTDDAGNPEAMTSAAREAVAPPRTNTPATGAPVIQGNAQVGQTIAVDTSDIEDQDGMDNAAFTYRWTAGGTDIQGATGESYNPVENDEGKTLRVRVSFTDDVGYSETLVSQPTTPVEPEHVNTPATGQPSISGEARVGQTLTAGTSTIQDQDGIENAVFTYQWTSEGADIQGANANVYTLAEGDEKKTLRVRVSFTDDAGNSESLLSLLTTPVEAEQVNAPATGQPSIAGDPKVGETLTVDISGISDADGTENAAFEFRWASGGMDIEGATGDSYTAVENDEGKTLRVRVSFTDDAGNPEELTSEPVGPVEQESTETEQPGAPENLSVSPGGAGELEVNWDPPASDGGAEIIAYIVRWKESSGSWNSTADTKSASVSGTSRTITGLTPGTEYAVRVLAFNVAGGGPESEEKAGTPG